MTYMYMNVAWGTCEGPGLQRPEKGAGSLGDGAPYSC